jgi:hypothetical protein
MESGSAALLAYAVERRTPKQPPAHREGSLHVLDLLQRVLPFGFREEVALPQLLHTIHDAIEVDVDSVFRQRNHGDLLG